MATEKAKCMWVKIYVRVKLVEVLLAGFLIVSYEVMYASGMDPKSFAPLMHILLWTAFLWELVYCLYRIIFLYSKERFRIPMSLLSLVALPGWYALFSDLSGFQVMMLERVIAHLWFLPGLTPLMVVLSFCYDINVKSKIEEKWEKKAA